jgi:hypothetical protein
MSLAPFHWLESATVSIAATTAGTDRAALAKLPTGKVQIRLYNAGAGIVFIRKGADATATASVADLPIAPGSVEILTLSNNPASPITYIAAISASGSNTLYVTTGAGI